MDVLFHFALAIIAGMAIGLHKKHGLRIIVILAFLSLLIDFDHIISLFAANLPARFLHNIFIFFLLPAVLFLLAYKFETKGTKLRKCSAFASFISQNTKCEIKWQSYTLIFFAMMVSHLVADYFGKGGVPFFYPLSLAEFQMPAWLDITFVKSYWFIATRAGFALLFGGAVIMLAHFAEDFIYFLKGKKTSKKKAWKKVKEEI